MGDKGRGGLNCSIPLSLNPKFRGKIETNFKPTIPRVISRSSKELRLSPNLITVPQGEEILSEPVCRPSFLSSASHGNQLHLSAQSQLPISARESRAQYFGVDSSSVRSSGQQCDVQNVNGLDQASRTRAESCSLQLAEEGVELGRRPLEADQVGHTEPSSQAKAAEAVAPTWNQTFAGKESLTKAVGAGAAMSSIATVMRHGCS